MKILPNSRTKDIVVQNLGKETLVYDLTVHKAFQLNETSSIIFNACNGKQTFDELKRQHQFTDDLIYLALDELKGNNLIEDYQNNYFAGLSRREVIKKVGLASMIALPVIIGITAPTAAQAQSTCANPGGSPAGTTLFGGINCGNSNTAQCQSVCASNGAGSCCSGRTQLSGTCPTCTCQCAA